MSIRQNPQGPVGARKPKWSKAEKDILRKAVERNTPKEDVLPLLPGRTLDAIDRRLKLLRAGQDISLPLQLMRMGGQNAKVTVLHPKEPGLKTDCYLIFKDKAKRGSEKLLAALKQAAA